MPAGRTVWWIAGVGVALRLALALAVGPGYDEAYHTLYVEHPAWSYFDHPPLMAVVAGLGRAVAGPSIAAMRLGFIALFAGSTLLVGRIAGRAYGPAAAAPAALALNACWYFGAAVGTFILPDGPLLFFWLLTIDRLMAAVDRPTLLAWLWVGLAWGGALLSKYHGVLIPVAFLAFAVIDDRARRSMRTPWPYLAAAVGLLMFAPVIVWNARHDWLSFAFQGGRAVNGLAIRPGSLLKAIGGQVGYLTPWMVLAIGLAVIRTIREPSPDPERRRWDRFFAAFAAVPLGGFAAIALVKPVLPHWGLIGAASLMPIVGAAWADRLRERPGPTRRRLAILPTLTVLLTVGAAVQANTGFLRAVLPGRSDPTGDMVGWEAIAREVRRRGLLDDPGRFVFTGNWHVSGQLARALGPEVPVACYREDDARGFASWSDPADYVGRDGVLVSFDDRTAEPECYGRWFCRIEPAGRFDVVRDGEPIRSVRLYLCREQTMPFPFAYR